MPFREVWVSPVLMQNSGIWNFHGSLTLNNGKLIGYFKNLWYDIHEDAAFIDALAFVWSGFLRFLLHHTLCWRTYMLLHMTHLHVDLWKDLNIV